MDIVKELHGEVSSLSRDQITAIVDSKKISWPRWLTTDFSFRKARNEYNIPWKLYKENELTTTTESQPRKISTVSGQTHPAFEGIRLVPNKLDSYVPFGFHTQMKKIIKSGRWFPVFIQGHSGNGKTTTVEQVCHELNRECIRINITAETCEDDLLGSLRLEEGSSPFYYGPVVEAMLRGSILLLDEIDYASPKIACIQSVLEGNSIFLKKICQRIVPAPGFNVVATANTKGQGSDDGKYVGTSVMNEAFLDRFLATFEQDYPSAAVEKNILNKYFANNGITEEDFINKLVRWASDIRANFNKGVITQVITTRRLLHICNSFLIFPNREESIKMALGRYDADTQRDWWELYKKIDPTMSGAPIIDHSVKPPAPKEHIY